MPSDPTMTAEDVAFLQTQEAQYRRVGGRDVIVDADRMNRILATYAECERLTACVVSAEAECERLRAENAVLLADNGHLNTCIATLEEASAPEPCADTRRLDWLASFGEMQVGDSNAPAPLFWWTQNNGLVSLRAAIDAAMTEAPDA